jgi:hypothetical protein
MGLLLWWGEKVLSALWPVAPGLFGRVDDATRQDYFPSSDTQDSGAAAGVWTVVDGCRPGAAAPGGVRVLRRGGAATGGMQGAPHGDRCARRPHFAAVTLASSALPLAVLSATGGVLMAVVLAAVVVVTVGVLWIVFGLMGDDAEDEHPVSH